MPVRFLFVRIDLAPSSTMSSATGRRARRLCRRTDSSCQENFGRRVGNSDVGPMARRIFSAINST
eukprot:11044841-Lingulodinium_polyedra.AAC.1